MSVITIYDLAQKCISFKKDKKQFFDDEQSYSAREMCNQADILAEEIIEILGNTKMKPVVGILVGHNLFSLVAILACSKAGVIYTIINRTSNREQAIHQIQDSDAGLILFKKSFLPQVGVQENDFDVPFLNVEIILKKKGNLLRDLAFTEKFPSSTPTDICSLVYTSGSTGKQKGVIVPNRTLVEGAEVVSEYLDLSEKDKLLGVLPLGFDYGLNQFLSCLFSGASYYLHNYLLPGDLLAAIDKFKITGLAVVPTMWPGILQGINVSKEQSKYSLKSLRYVTSGGGPHPMNLRTQIRNALPNTKIFVQYGLTESFRSTYLPNEYFTKLDDCIGKPVSGVELLILDEELNELPPFEIGEIYHRGRFVNYGYLNSDFATHEKNVSDIRTSRSYVSPKMIRSGDLGYKDDNGFIYFVGRRDGMLKLAGHRFAPTEIEKVVMEAENVRTCAAVQKDGNSDLVIFLELKDTSLGVSFDSILKLCKLELPRYAQPKDFKIIERIPLTTTGKIDYNVLRNNLPL